MIFISIILLAAVCFLFYYSTRTFCYWRDKKVPGPTPIPLFGNIRESALRRKHIGIIYKEIYDKYPNEPVIGFYRMTNPSLIIRDLNVAKQILIRDFDIFPDRGIEFSKEGLGDNLFHCDLTIWKTLRNRLTPMFTSGKLRKSFHLLNETANHLVSYLDTIVSNEKDYEVHSILQKYTMASIIATSFGLNINIYGDNQSSVEKAGYFIFRSTYAAELDMLFPNIWRKINSSLYPDLVNKFSYEMVKMVNNQRNGVATNRDDIMDALLALKNETKTMTVNEKMEQIEITDHVMAGQVFIFFAAGFGNNALSLSYTLFYLAKHQNVQDKLIEEVDETLRKYKGKLTYDAVKEMTYIDKVFSEVLRMHTLTNSIQRSAAKNYKLPDTDLIISKGTTVIISPYAIHRDSELYPNPDNFDPERFSPENSANRHPCAYLPFGTGPRSCLGRQWAKQQFAVAIAKFFSKFRVKPSEKTKILEDYEPMCTLLATKGGIHVNILRRNL